MLTQSTKTLFVFFQLCFFFFNPVAHADDFCAKLAVVMGRAVNQAGEKLRTGQTVPRGTEIKTGPNSLVKLVLLDESILDLGSSSRLRITACQGQNWQTKINLEMDQGSLRALVNKNPQKKREEFKLKTVTSVLAVRGTEFFVTWQKNEQGQVLEQIGVSEGQVEVRSLFDAGMKPIALTTGTEFRGEGRVERKEGEVKVESSAPPRIDQFTAEEQKQAEQTTRVENRVFEDTIDLSSEPPAERREGPQSRREESRGERRERAAQFINSKMESSERPGREVASDKRVDTPQGEQHSGKKHKDGSDKKTGEINTSSDPTSAGAQAGAGSGTVGNPFTNGPIPISIPTIVKWEIKK